jgi:cytochrome c oxidase assembly protein subunit 11
MSDKNVNRTVRKLLLTAACMFAFGYALVPLYRVYCDLTGRGTARVAEADAGMGEVDAGRLVTVVLDTNTRDIPWTFKAERHKTKVRPGELSEAVFMVENRSGRTVTGRAIPSVSPAQAGVYISKMDCFCFDEQVLAPGESREMQVRFIVDTDLPERFSSLTLSYTFFDVGDRAPAGAQTGHKANA